MNLNLRNAIRQNVTGNTQEQLQGYDCRCDFKWRGKNASWTWSFIRSDLAKLIK